MNNTDRMIVICKSLLIIIHHNDSVCEHYVVVSGAGWVLAEGS